MFCKDRVEVEILPSLEYTFKLTLFTKKKVNVAIFCDEFICWRSMMVLVVLSFTDGSVVGIN